MLVGFLRNSMVTLNFTPAEYEVLTALIEYHIGSEIPDWIDENAYDSVVDKVLGTV